MDIVTLQKDLRLLQKIFLFVFFSLYILGQIMRISPKGSDQAIIAEYSGIKTYLTITENNTLIGWGANNTGLIGNGTLNFYPYFARKMEKTYIDTIMSNIDYSLDMCHVNGVPKICKDTTPSEREQMKVEIHKIFQEEIMKIEPYYIKIAEILLEHGADINKKSNGIAPLHFAANVPNNEKPILLKYLLEKGADVNIRDFQGSTPLFVANFADNKEVIDLLIKFGADTAIRNDKGILYKDFKTGELYDYSY